VTSPDLNLDRLIPADHTKKNTAQTSPKKESGTKKQSLKERKRVLPPAARNLTAKIQIDAPKGRYRGQKFQNLKLNAVYDQGVIKSYDISFMIDKNPIVAKGSADLRDLEHVTFEMDSDIQGLPFNKMTLLLGLDERPVHGPVSLTSRLKGRTGGSKDLLSSLDGTLNMEIGPGRLMKIGNVGNLLASILTFTSIKGVLSGKMLDNLVNEGIRFEHIKYKANFKGGIMNINRLFYKSDALDMNAQGTVGLLNERLNIKAELVPFGTLDKVSGFVPVAGKAAASLTKIYLDLRGSIEHPKIKTRMTKGVVKETGDAIKKSGTAVKKATDLVGKGLKKVFGK
jgi:hypothetical protein